ncbi:hypothetical protein VTL71DRAFT_6847 [Oculimacula yallundae]|uniref:Chromo domain-containing protein n=1 Tax=Oculimacula yallundae TaxID=86028 RepID=A0ABR4BV22_9HELO
MYEISENYLRLLRAGGIMLVVDQVIKEELADPEIQRTSAIVEYTNLARISIPKSAMDMPFDIFRGIITGNLLRENLIPAPELFEMESSQSSAPPSVKGTTITTSNESYTSEDEQVAHLFLFNVEKIVESKIDPLQERVIYQVKWENRPSKMNSWEPLRNFWKEGDDPVGLQAILDHHKDDTMAPYHGLEDRSRRLLETTEKKPIIYGHWFLSADPQSMYAKPSKATLLSIIELGEWYIKELDPTDISYIADRDYQLEIIMAVDFPDSKFGFKTGGWDRAWSAQGWRRHISTVANPSVVIQSRLEKWRDVMFPTMKSQLALVDDGDDVKYTWSEIGITSDGETRRKAHANHSGTTGAFAFLECLSAHENGGSYRWAWQTLAYYRDRHEGPLLECFFSRLAQSYIWTGGVNPIGAGISTAAADKMTQEERLAAHADFNFPELDYNISDNKRRLEILNFAAGESYREAIKKEAEETKKIVVEKEQAVKKAFLNKAERMLQTLEDLDQLNLDDEKIEKTLPVSRRLLETTQKMHEMTRK